MIIGEIQKQKPVYAARADSHESFLIDAQIVRRYFRKKVVALIFSRMSRKARISPEEVAR
jgi:hypothetical protein